MKHPRKIQRYCARCATHTEHAVSIYKKGRERSLSEGRRRHNRRLKGYGSYPSKLFKRNAKINKRTLPIVTCSQCGRKEHKTALRLKKFELV